MGNPTSEDSMAVRIAPSIPSVYRMYLSHHLRNSLMGIALVERHLRERKLSKEAEDLRGIVRHMIGDMEKVGL